MDRIDSYNFSIYQGRRQFTDGPPGTVINAEWLTAVQEEICSVIESQGITLEKSENDQLVQALRAFAVPDWASPWFDVTEYGAKPLASISDSDGTDSAIGITRTINAASEATGSARYVILPPGLYDCRSPVYFGDRWSFVDWRTGQPYKASLLEGYGSRLRFRGTPHSVIMYGGLNDQAHGLYPYSAPATWTNHMPLDYPEFVPDWKSTTGAEAKGPVYPNPRGLTTDHEQVFSVRNMTLDVEAVAINVRAPIFLHGVASYVVDETYVISHTDPSGRVRYSTFCNVCATVPGSGTYAGKELIISRRRGLFSDGHLNWNQYMFRRDMTFSQAEAYGSLARTIGKDKA